MIINLNNVINKVVGAAKILVGNASGDATAVDMSGEATIDNTGAVTLDNNSVTAKVLTGGTFIGYINDTDSILSAFEAVDSSLDAFLPKDLTSAKVFVGNGSGTAVERTLSLSANGGTFALSNTGVFTFPNANSSTRGLLTAADYVKAVSREVQFACSDETTALTASSGVITFRMPRAATITGVRASLTTAQSSGNILTIDINESGTSILSTKLTIDNTEKTSTTATTPAVISDTSVADDAEITVDIDQIGDGTATGLKVTIYYTI